MYISLNAMNRMEMGVYIFIPVELTPVIVWLLGLCGLNQVGVVICAQEAL